MKDFFEELIKGKCKGMVSNLAAPSGRP